MNSPEFFQQNIIKRPATLIFHREVWLSTKGSPSSKITKFEKKNVQKIAAY